MVVYRAGRKTRTDLYGPCVMRRRAMGAQAVGQPESTPRLKCVVCSGPHATWNKTCPARKAAINEHRMETMYAGPFFQIPNQCTVLGSLPGDMVSGDHPNLRHPVWCTHSVAS